MARQTKTPAKREIDAYMHDDKERVNNPPVGLVTPDTDKDLGKKTYSYDPHLDPTLQWAGKVEHTSFEVPTVSLHVHERIDPKTIIQQVKKKNGGGQPDLFHWADEERPIREAIEFYKHKNNWTNRLIAGDSLMVMNSLLEKESMAGQVQMVFMDPPYGIRYGSNFQPFVSKRDVKDGKDDDLTAEPEMIRAFRDTWELGIHSYLTYMRDRLLLARELLHESGSCFVQISDDNVHHIRELMDEVFGESNFVSQIVFQKTSSGLESKNKLSTKIDYLVWYSKDFESKKYRPLFRKKYSPIEEGYRFIELLDGSRRQLTKEELDDPDLIPKNSKFFTDDNLTKSGPGSRYEVEFEGEKFTPGTRWWGTPPESMQNLIAKKRIMKKGNIIRYVKFYDDFRYTA
ncbi:MAG: DNA methyltransferase, partial [Pseudomonadota bacterium]